MFCPKCHEDIQGETSGCKFMDTDSCYFAGVEWWECIGCQQTKPEDQGYFLDEGWLCFDCDGPHQQAEAEERRHNETLRYPGV